MISFQHLYYSNETFTVHIVTQGVNNDQRCVTSVTMQFSLSIPFHTVHNAMRVIFITIYLILFNIYISGSLKDYV